MQLERDQIQCEQRNQNYDSFDVPMGGFTRDAWLALFPQSSDVGGRSTGIATYQVPGSNSTGQVGALRKVRTLVSGGKNAGMTTRGWSAPGAVLALFSEKGQSPLGIYSLYRRETYVVGSQNVVNLNHFLSDAHFWNPENNQREIGEQSRGWGACNCNGDSLGYQGKDPCQQQYSDAHAGKQTGELGSKDLHVTTLTRAEEVCIG